MYTTDDSQHSPIAISLKQNGKSISTMTLWRMRCIRHSLCHFAEAKWQMHSSFAIRNSISILTPVSILEFQKAKILRNDLVYSQQHWSAANIWHLLSIPEFEKAKILRNDLAYSKQHWTAANILFFFVKDWANFIK